MSPTSGAKRKAVSLEMKLNINAQLWANVRVPNTFKVGGAKLCYSVKLGAFNAFSTYNIFNLQWIYWDVAQLRSIYKYNGIKVYNFYIKSA